MFVYFCISNSVKLGKRRVNWDFCSVLIHCLNGVPLNTQTFHRKGDVGKICTQVYILINMVNMLCTGLRKSYTCSLHDSLVSFGFKFVNIRVTPSWHHHAVGCAAYSTWIRLLTNTTLLVEATDQLNWVCYCSCYPRKIGSHTDTIKVCIHFCNTEKKR